MKIFSHTEHHSNSSIQKKAFREYEFDELIISFRNVLTKPGEAIARVILIGPSGSGKSHILHWFRKEIQQTPLLNLDLNFQLQCLIVDCSKHKSTKSIVYELIRQIEPAFKASLLNCQTAEL
ncbi:MAG: AAA family ATPase, partial [Asgard group archaeon]|nr:AAA family ATPase [Asgard group archaeon]